MTLSSEVCGSDLVIVCQSSVADYTSITEQRGGVVTENRVRYPSTSKEFQGKGGNYPYMTKLFMACDVSKNGKLIAFIHSVDSHFLMIWNRICY